MGSETAEKIRKTLNQNAFASAIALVIATAAILIYAGYAAGYLGRRGGPDPATMKAFFMDEETGEIEIHLVREIPPLPGKSGNPTVVLARYFTTSTDEAKKLIYLERYTPECKLAIESSHGAPPNLEVMDALRRGTQVRSPEPGAPWYSVDTREGRAVVNAVAALDPDPSKVRMVSPP